LLYRLYPKASIRLIATQNLSPRLLLFVAFIVTVSSTGGQPIANSAKPAVG
jgi:hypothetical protein